MADNDPFMVGKWLVEPALDRIECESDVRNLRPQVMELLVYLANRPGKVVSTDQLLRDLWDGRIVSEGSVYNCVSELRLVLAGQEDAAMAVETIPKKGYRLVAPVTPCKPAAAAPSGNPRLNIAVTVAITLIVTATLSFWLLDYGETHGEIRSVAVLPLDNHSPNPARDEYFVDGMTEALIARLGQMRGLRVISRTSAMRLKGSDMTIPEIARALNVDGVIEGSVMTADDEVRVTLQLVDGETDAHVWTQTYVRQLDDIFDLQDEMANSISSELRAQIGAPGDDSVAVSLPPRQPVTSNPEAFRAYLKARYHFNSFGEENFRAALRFYDAAIEFDPVFALAYASRAEACMQPLVIFNGIRTLEDCGRDALRAVALDDKLAGAFAALGFTQLGNWEWQQSEQSLKRAIELDPNSVMARQWHTLILRTTYRFDEALAEIRRAEELDPLNLFVKTMVGWPLYDMGRYKQALSQWDDVIDMDGDYMLAHYNRGLAYIQMRDAEGVFSAADRVAQIGGDASFEARMLRASAHAISGGHEEARRIIAGVERDGGVFVAAWISSVYLMMDQEDEALSRLERGLEERSIDMVSLSEPKFDVVRQHPRFLAVSRKMGLPDAT